MCDDRARLCGYYNNNIWYTLNKYKAYKGADSRRGERKKLTKKKMDKKISRGVAEYNMFWLFNNIFFFFYIMYTILLLHRQNHRERNNANQ